MQPTASGTDGGAAGEGAGEIGALALDSGGRRLAVPAAEVDEVVRPPARIAAIPGAPAWLVGIANARGRLLTLIDAGALLGGPPAAAGPESRAVIVERGPFLYGLLVDAVVPVPGPVATGAEPATLDAGGETWPLLDWRAALAGAARRTAGETAA